jgi:hypothetical protein
MANYLRGALTCHSDVLQPGGHPVCAEAAGSCARSCDHNQRTTALRTPALPRLGMWRSGAVTMMARWVRYRSNSYSGRPSRSAQAVATAELGVSVPGTVAQPPFSMIDRRSHHEALPNFNFAGASACCWNLSAQIGASTSTTAVSARSFATFSAVLSSVHPKSEKPSTDITAPPMTAPQIPAFKVGENFIDLMSCARVCAPIGPIPERSALLVPGTIRTTTYLSRAPYRETNRGVSSERELPHISRSDY